MTAPQPSAPTGRNTTRTHRFVTTRDGQALRVRVLGEGQPVLLLHGLGMHSAHWLPFVWPHRHRFRFYMPDFRGAGGSRKLSFNQQDVFQNGMEDVEDVVAHFALRDLLVVGYSLGASTALHWLRAGGFERVRRYLHIDQSVCIPNAPDWSHGLLGARQAVLFDALREVATRLSAHGPDRAFVDLPVEVRMEAMDALARALSNLGAGPVLSSVCKLAARWPRLLELGFQNPTPANLQAYLSSYLNAHDYRQSLLECRTPVTWMVGMRSALYDPEGQLAAARLAPNSQIVRFERSGHALPLTEPLKFARELARFLEPPAAP